MTDLTRQGANVAGWGPPQEKAFTLLKEKLCSAPILQSPDFSREFVVNTDASEVAVGAVLQQDFGRGLQPIAYESQKLSDAERRYLTYARELLAIVHACSCGETIREVKNLPSKQITCPSSTSSSNLIFPFAKVVGWKSFKSSTWRLSMCLGGATKLPMHYLA